MPDDSGTRVELGLRGAMLAKASLELLSLDPKLARLQLAEIAKQFNELNKFLKEKGF